MGENNIDRRRQFLQGALTTAACATLAPPSFAQTKEPAYRSFLDQAKWSKRNRDIVNQLIARYGSSAKNYHQQHRPYAVFDWDNTAIMNDCQEALFMYQINTLSFKLKPEEFSTIIRQNVPPGQFSADYKNAAGELVDLESICKDLDADYRFLFTHFSGMGESKTLEQMLPYHETLEFWDFRAKLYYLYEAVNGTHGVHVGYPWVVYFLTNMTTQDLTKLVEASNDTNLGGALVKTTYTSPEKLSGKAGVVSVSHTQGMRLCTEIATLMDVFRQHDIDVYVCTASLEDVVAVFASTPKYGYHVPRDHVLGLRLEQQNGKFINKYLKNWPLTWGPGKTEVIKRELMSKRGYGPIFVAGDSDGDYDMLRDFPDTQIGLIVNRLKKGKIGELSQQAANTINSNAPRFLLQGRQEATGNWLPTESSLKHGKTSLALLP